MLKDEPGRPAYGRPLAAMSRRGQLMLRRSRLLRDVSRWLVEHSPGLRALVLEQFHPRSAARYRQWIARHDTLTAGDMRDIRSHIGLLPPTRFSIVMTSIGVLPEALRRQLGSVVDQLYPHWDLRIATGETPSPELAGCIAAVAADPRVSVVRRHGRVGQPCAGDHAPAPTAGAFVVVLLPGVSLAPHALYEVAATIAAHPAAGILYADEDAMDACGLRSTPVFKTDWSPDLMLGEDVIGGFGVFQRSVLERAGAIATDFAPERAYNLSLRAMEVIPPAQIVHIPTILSHRDVRQPVRGVGEQNAAAVQAHLERCGETRARALPHPRMPGCTHVIRSVPTPAPLVTLIVPTRDRATLLAQCADGVLNRTNYPTMELIIADNDSQEAETAAVFARLADDPRVRVLPCPGPFNFSALNNRAAAAAHGDVLVLLNNDVDVIDGDWLAEMVANAVRPDVGIVGAKLLFRDGRLQHGGVALGIGGVAGHLELFAPRHAPGYGRRLAFTRDVSAVTAACLAIRRDVFHAVGGLNERELAVAYNDIDLCLRVREAGYRVVWTPFAELFHLESASRAHDFDPEQRPRYEREVAFMQQRWGHVLRHDPFYGPNFSLRDGHYHLTKPRRSLPWREAGSAPQG